MTRTCFLRPAQDVFPPRVRRTTSSAGTRQWGRADGVGAGSRPEAGPTRWLKKSAKRLVAGVLGEATATANRNGVQAQRFFRPVAVIPASKCIITVNRTDPGDFL